MFDSYDKKPCDLNLVMITSLALKCQDFKVGMPIFQLLQELSISLIIQGCSMVLYSIWPRNHTSHKKFYFNEFVANVLRDVIGIVIFDL
jgi:hypothetical protein